MKDSGADFFLDYVDFGLVTTYGISSEDYLPGLKGLLTEAEKSNPDIILLECGGDVMWANIPSLLKNKEVMKNVKCATMCSTYYMVALGANYFTRDLCIDVPIYFNVPIEKESFYRKSTFENLVHSKVYNIMNKDEMSHLTDKLLCDIEVKK
ncbi:MAG: hypothetical protein ACOC1K_03850 [Nanoarchaeota archaeon]